MKKSVLLTAVIAFGVVVAACSPQNSNEVAGSPGDLTRPGVVAPGGGSSGISTLPGTITEDEAAGLNPEVVVPEFSGERNEELVERLTPEGAEVITDVEGSLILQSDMVFDELIAFYEENLSSLGANEDSLDDSVAGNWSYAGSFGDGSMITVDLRDDDGVVMIIVGY